jgi:anti-anti-sigma regulatory factor
VRDSPDSDVGQASWSMTFRIESAARGRFTVFILSGRIEKQAIAELRRLIELQPDRADVVLDLKDVSVVDRDALHFFADCEADEVKLENCAAYIREWMEREKD